jgi:putative PIN family toxin of toxin-antitoxin system
VRILLDSNVWLAILTTDGQCRRMWRAVRAQSAIHASPDILGEIAEKLHGKFGFTPRHACLLTHFVRRQTLAVTTNVPSPNVCRDPDDDRILAAAVQARCAYLVTGDRDLLALSPFADVSIVTPREFWERVSSI